MKSQITLRSLLLGTTLFYTTFTSAAELTWDNGASTGNWNTADLNWTAVPWDNAEPDDAIFGATGVGTVTLSEAITAGTITFNTAGYTIDTATFGLTINNGITTNQNAIIQSGVGGSIILGADNAMSVASTRTLTVNSVISGATFGITKSGAGTLTLAGANTYGGDTTLNGGVVNLNNASGFGAGDVLVTGASRINITGGNTYANAIDVGATLDLQIPSATATTSEITGVLTGSSTINLINSGSGNNQTNLFFSNANNTFTGSVVGPAGNAVGADYFRFNSIGDAGTFTLNKGGNRGGVIYSGASDIEFDVRQIVLGTSLSTGNGTIGGYTATLSGLNGNGAPINSFANNASNAAHTVTFNADMAMTSIAGNSFFYFDGSNAGNNTFAGDIGDPTGAQTLGIGKWGTGKWILSGDNSFLGDLLVANGTLATATIDVAANNQPIGKGSLIILGHANTSGTLEYTGSANASTDKQIVLGNIRNNNQSGAGGIVNNSTTGKLTFTNATFNSIAGNTLTTVTRTLTLGGSNAGANTISGKIQNNATGAAVALTKTGAGTWILEGDNTYTGTTAIQGGLLIASNANAIGTGAISLSGNAILGLGNSDFTRVPNFGATVSGDRITFLDSAGFAAFGADRVVNFGGASGIVAIGSSATPGIIGNMNGKTFILGHATATHKVTVTNTLDFGGGTRTIQVNNGTAAVDAEISGVIQPQAAGTAGLNKTGAGTLLLSNSNTYNGDTAINGGTLIITGATQGTSAITFSGGGILGLDIASPVTAASATVDFTDQQVLVTGSPTLPSYTLLTGLSVTGAPTLAAPVPGYTLVTDGTTLKLESTGGDITPPTLSSITDNVSGGPVNIGDTVTYTVTFSEDMDAASVTSADFANNGTAGANIGAVTETITPGVFTVPVTVTSPGTLVLRINTLAVLEDVAGNDLDTDPAILDDTTITVRNAYQTWALTNAISSAPGADKDGDGVSNAIEFLLGGDVSTNDLSKLPKVTMTATNMIITFERKRSSTDGITGCEVEVGTTLTGWPDSFTVGATTAGSDPEVVVTESSPSGFDTITVTVPKGTDPSKFARLEVTVTE